MCYITTQSEGVKNVIFKNVNCEKSRLELFLRSFYATKEKMKLRITL